MSESIGPDDDEISFETLIERAKREGGKLLAEFNKRGLAPREKIMAWREDVARGDRARAFLSSDFWRKDLEPFLRAESRMKPCAMDAIPTTLERASIEYIYKSGETSKIDRIEKTMREWVSAGDRAALLLRAEGEKRKRTEPARG